MLQITDVESRLSSSELLINNNLYLLYIFTGKIEIIFLYDNKINFYQLTHN